MRLLLQRVTSASVSVGGAEIAAISGGILVLAGVEWGDDAATAAKAAAKVSELRIFSDQSGRMNLSAETTGAAFLVVPNFTLAASVARGRRPSFDKAAPGEVANPVLDTLVSLLRARGFTVATGPFGAHMEVKLVNDGPVTFVVEI